MFFAGLFLLPVAWVEAREWHLQDGEIIEADFYFRDGRETWLKNHEGELFVVESSRLSVGDLDFIQRFEEVLRDLELPPWPRQVQPAGGFRLTGGPASFRSAHFQILAEDAPASLVNETAVILENAYHMIGTLPLPLDPAPPHPLRHFAVRILDRPQFEESFGNSVKNLYPEKVKGAYMAKPRELWLPLDATPAPDFTATLVHEMAHQSMHDWLPLLPLWFIEGFAEYLAAIPYRNQVFRFDLSEEGLRETLQSRYGSPPLLIAHPARQLASETWQNSSNDYLSALFLVFFLAEYDRDGKGTGLQAYLAEINAAREQTATWFSEIQRMADDYNARVREFHNELAKYEQEIESVKSRLRSGERVFVRESGPDRVVIAGTPQIPSRPVAPPRPEDLPAAVTEGRSKAVNLITSAKQSAVIQILQGRSFEAFAEEMKNAFHSRGFAVEYR